MWLSSIFNLENRYIPALFVIIVLLCLAYFNNNEIIKSIANDGKVINISGKQRMLSQKILIEATQFISTKDNISKKEIQIIIDKMKSSHDYLLSFTLSNELNDLYFNQNLSHELFAYLKNFEDLIANKKIISMDEMIIQSKAVLYKLDLAVKIYEKEYQYKISELKTRESIIYLLIILTLIIIGFLYFYPASKKIKKDKDTLENEIRIKTNKLQKSIDIISKNVIYSRTDLRGIITYASDAFCNMSGFTKDELIGKPHNIIRHPDIPKEVFENMWSEIQKEKKWKGEIKNLTKDGGFYWVEAHIYPEYDIHSNHIGYAAVRHDITHKKALEELNKDLKKTINKEVEQNRLKEQTIFEQSKRVQIAQMIENIAHQWRQPLNMISVLTSGLDFKIDSQDLSKEEIRKTLDKIIDVTSKLSQTIETFNQFTHISDTIEEFDINEMCDNIFSIVNTNLKESNIDFTVNKLDENSVIQSNQSDIINVLMHLINNAKEILLERQVDNPHITLELKEDNQFVKIMVIDNGGGIDEDILPKIFDPYFTTKHQYTGTGIGLYTCYNIIHNKLLGSIKAQNNYKGAEFTVSIPLKLNKN